jgi:RNA polymerase sigma-70 factor (ECF subfamily)
MTAVNETFVELVKQHAGILHKVTTAWCREQHDREDLAQEIVLQLWRSYGRYDRDLRFSTWMYRIAMNVAISHYRGSRVRAAQTLPLDEVTAISDGSDAADADDTRLLYDLIRELDELNRALIVLYLDGHSHAEIGSILGLTPTNVATRVNRIKDQLRNRYMEKTA